VRYFCLLKAIYTSLPVIIFNFVNHEALNFCVTPGEIPGTHFQRLSRPQGTWFCRGVPRKKSPVTPPGIDPGTVRLVAQRLNHPKPRQCGGSTNIYLTDIFIFVLWVYTCTRVAKLRCLYSYTWAVSVRA